MEAGTLAVTPFELIEGAETYVTFKTRLGTIRKGENDREIFREHYRLYVSAVLIRGKMILFSLYSNRPDDRAEELALAWRDANLAVREAEAPLAKIN